MIKKLIAVVFEKCHFDYLEVLLTQLEGDYKTRIFLDRIWEWWCKILENILLLCIEY